MWTLLFYFSVLVIGGVHGAVDRFDPTADYYTADITRETDTTDQPSCRYNCGSYMGSCSCYSYCRYDGNCCHDYYDYCSSTTIGLETATSINQPSCRYNCGSYMGSCSCKSYCQYYGNCCYDYNDYCSSTTVPEPTPTDQPSCRYNCGSYMGSCSCSSYCQYNGNCCHDYYDYCLTSTLPPDSTTEEPGTTTSECGGYLYSSWGTFYSPNYPNYYPNNAECVWYIRPGRKFVRLEFSNVGLEYESSCSYDAIYVYDGPSTSSRLLDKFCGRNSSIFYSTGYYLTVRFRSDGSASDTGFRADYSVENQPSCRYNCGYNMGSCSCSSSCQYYGNCCHDYYSYCDTTTVEPTTDQPSCRYNCGYNMGSCSCSSSCQYYGNCCHDYYSYCDTTTVEPSTDQPSCRYNCGYNMGSCSCESYCRYYGNCCYDYYDYCSSTTVPEPTPTERPSCRYNCGSYMGSCSCSSSCRYYGNCCHDYYSYCYSTTSRPTTDQPSCRYNCGYHMGSCSCSSSCQYYGNCCHDYYSYCRATSPPPPIPTTGGSCGGYLFGSGTFSSPNHPHYYHDNSYCVWQIKAEHDQRVVVSFTFLQLDNCCSCDYISIYDGPSVGSRYLGKLCNNTVSTFYSSSNYMTVVFRTDSSVVARGFQAEFMSSLLPNSGRVDCSADKMHIVISKSYLDSLGYDGKSLYLNDPYCRPQVSSNQVVFDFPSNTCGNIREFNNGRVVYSNTVRGDTSSYGEITRRSYFRLNVTCQMDQDSVSHTMFIVKNPGNSSIAGKGRFNTTMAFYTSSSFYYKVTQVPYEVSLNEKVFVQVDLTRNDSSLVLFIDTCMTSPSQFDFQTRSYYLIRNGCPADSTYQSYVSGTRAYARFAFRAFRFLRASESVYIQCRVLICQATDYSSRCRRGCTRRVARDLKSEHESQTLVVGPIKLKGPEKKENEEPEKQNEV